MYISRVLNPRAAQNSGALATVLVLGDGEREVECVPPAAAAPVSRADE
jgi:hypothetical protein